MAMRYAVGNDQLGQPSWWLYGDNNKVVAWAGESFPSVCLAERAADDFKASAGTAEFDVYDEVGGKWRWQAWLTNIRVATSANGFTTKQNARRAADNVRGNATDASGP
ncbi:MAG: hypothetical protein JWR37_5492 [Mycobacterium sp.]|jgi:uncharacterized protein YegP (UPF0339 family)|nr:hypothetical protein [Mycobacterium sp.]